MSTNYNIPERAIYALGQILSRESPKTRTRLALAFADVFNRAVSNFNQAQFLANCEVQPKELLVCQRSKQ